MNNIYKPEEMLLYQYYDGEKMVAVDPLAVFKRFLNIQGDLIGALAVARSAHKDAPSEHEKAVKLVREFFKLKPWDPETNKGLTELASLDLMDHFLTFCEDIKKNSNPTQTSSEETSDTTPTLPAVDPTMKPTLDSGSIENDNKTEPPGQLQEEQQLLSV